jgi:purine-binding chemotaxis protein CheW
MAEIRDGHEDESSYLLFKVGREVYGTPLLGVREVVEPQEPKPIPNTVDFFSGVINLRGQVVGVVDLRKRFDQDVTKHSGMALLVFDTDGGPLGALVDEIECVTRIPREKIETTVVVRSHVSLDCLIGIGNQDGRLVSLIDLKKVLDGVELKSIPQGLG